MIGLKKNYSQVWQDIFALVVNDAKRDGTFIEIGGAQPFIGNNTWLLEKEYNWRGFSVELDEELCKMWMGQRPNTHLFVDDANVVDYSKQLRKIQGKIVKDWMTKAKSGIIDFFDIYRGLQYGDITRAHPYETDFLHKVLTKDKIIDRFRKYFGGKKGKRERLK